MNHKYFETPTIENSYWAGLIATDGCIDDKSHGQKRLSLGFSEKDLDSLEILKKTLSLSTKLSYRMGKKFISPSNGKEYLGKAFYDLRCTSNKICDDLNKNWNITPRKTNTLLPPDITDLELIKAFLIGVIDGDGSIYWDKTNKHFAMRIYGNSEPFLFWCKKSLARVGEVLEAPNLQNIRNSFNIYYGNKKAREIFKALKDVDVPRLERKWSKVYG